MNRIPGLKILAPAFTLLSLLMAAGIPARASSRGDAVLYVHVTDAQSGDPIFQARITLRFHEPGSVWKMKRSKLISYSAKTDKKGEYRFVDIPKGPIQLMITAPQHETFGKQFKLSEDNQVIEIKLKKPRPVL